jgi:hypothetical protein
VIGVRAHRERRQGGQALAEFALIVPVLVLALMAILEFGLAFNHYMTIEYGTREGSRTGSALARGGRTNCVGGVDLVGVDQQVIAAVQRILKSPGSPISLADVSEIRIYRADAAGNQVGSQANSWRYTGGSGPDLDPGVGVERLDFSQSSSGWPVCSRNNGVSPDSIGVRIVYNYNLQTPLGAAMRYFGGNAAASFTFDDRTVMALNPDS